MAEKLDRVTAELKKNRHIVVWDNFESASGIEGTAISPLLPPEDRQLLKKLIQNICRGKSKIIITSRSREEWLSIIHCFSISLDGLVGEERWHYCNEVVKLLGLRPDRDNAVFQTLMDKLEGHPLAMRAILLRLDEKNARQLLVELEMGFKGKGGDESTEKIHQALGIFAAVLPENFAPVLQFIGLHQRFVDVDYLEPMAETVKLNLSRSQIDPCLFALERGGMLHHVGNGIHRMHPALSGYLAARHPAEAGVLRGFVTVMATLADQLTPKELHEQRGWFQIHEENCYHALSLAPESGFELAVPALTQSLAAWALNNRDWESAKRLFLALRDFRHQRGHHEGEAGAYHQLGRIAEELRHWAEAEGWYRKSLEIKERQGNEHGAASSYHQLGIVAQEQRQWAAAEGWYRKSLEIEERQGNEHGAASSYHQLGIVAQEQRHWEEAEGWYRKSLEIEERQGNEHGAASSYHQLGRIAEEQGHWAEAEEWYRKALKIYKRYEDAHNANIVQGSQKRLAALRET
ncbi:MAG TPA: tetratricopeptide repeat protein, partial [Magnetococcales bacterium]|nr:tetratricopeptide repeat protein [Magnetococcales bacterium]